MTDLFLLDANVLIRAHEDYYPLDRIPQFWTWLEAQANAGLVKMPFEIYGEISDSRGHLAAWIKDQNIKDALLLKESPDAMHIRKVLAQGYAPDLKDDEIEKVGRDPFLVAYGLSDKKNRTVVTKEVSRPGAQRANRKIPDVCGDVGVKWMTDFQLFHHLKFSIP